MVGGRFDAVFARKLELTVCAQECPDLHAVFFRLQAARAVDEAAPRTQQGGGAFEDAFLQLLQIFQLTGCKAPLGIRPAPKNTRVGAGDIQQDGVDALACEAGTCHIRDSCERPVVVSRVLNQALQALF